MDTYCVRLEWFSMAKKRRAKCKTHKILNQKLQTLHRIMQMLRLITAHEIKTSIFFQMFHIVHSNYTQIEHVSKSHQESCSNLFFFDFSEYFRKLYKEVIRILKVFNYITTRLTIKDSSNWFSCIFSAFRRSDILKIELETSNLFDFKSNKIVLVWIVRSLICRIINIRLYQYGIDSLCNT